MGNTEKSRCKEELDALASGVIGAAIEVHQHLGPGLLESVYETALCHELSLRNIPFERQALLPVIYKGEPIESAYRLDLVIAGALVLELKAAEALLPIHQAQLLSYLKLGNFPLGLPINFHTTRLKDGIKRFVNGTLT